MPYWQTTRTRWPDCCAVPQATVVSFAGALVGALLFGNWRGLATTGKTLAPLATGGVWVADGPLSHMRRASICFGMMTVPSDVREQPPPASSRPDERQIRIRAVTVICRTDSAPGGRLAIGGFQ